jgi:hypothetical protein
VNTVFATASSLNDESPLIVLGKTANPATFIFVAWPFALPAIVN